MQEPERFSPIGDTSKSIVRQEEPINFNTFCYGSNNPEGLSGQEKIQKNRVVTKLGRHNLRVEELEKKLSLGGSLTLYENTRLEHHKKAIDLYKITYRELHGKEYVRKKANLMSRDDETKSSELRKRRSRVRNRLLILNRKLEELLNNPEKNGDSIKILQSKIAKKHEEVDWRYEPRKYIKNNMGSVNPHTEALDTQLEYRQQVPKQQANMLNFQPQLLPQHILTAYSQEQCEIGNTEEPINPHAFYYGTDNPEENTWGEYLGSHSPLPGIQSFPATRPYVEETGCQHGMVQIGPAYVEDGEYANIYFHALDKKYKAEFEKLNKGESDNKWYEETPSHATSLKQDWWTQEGNEDVIFTTPAQERVIVPSWFITRTTEVVVGFQQSYSGFQLNPPQPAPGRQDMAPLSYPTEPPQSSYEEWDYRG